MFEHTSLIIPAFNEADRIENVIEAGEQSPEIDSIIVVDDGSTDDTQKIISEHNAINVLHENNRGKFDALRSGVSTAREIGATSLLFLDADLQNLRPDHISEMVKPIHNRSAHMVIGNLDRTWAQNKILLKWGAMSGQRSLRPEIWDLAAEVDVSNPEVAMNAVLRHKKLHRGIDRIILDDVRHIGQREKENSLAKGFRNRIQIFGTVVESYAKLELNNT